MLHRSSGFGEPNAKVTHMCIIGKVNFIPGAGDVSSYCGSKTLVENMKTFQYSFNVNSYCWLI
jgi:hypothetical protein